MVPIKTTAKKYIINQLLITIADSLLKKNDLFTLSELSNLKYIIKEIKTKMVKNKVIKKMKYKKINKIVLIQRIIMSTHCNLYFF